MRSIFLIIVVFLILGVTCGGTENDPDMVGGNIHLRARRFDRAIEQYLKVLKKRPNDIVPIIALSSAHYMNKDYKKAVSYLYEAVNLDESEAEKQIGRYEDKLNTKYLKWQIYYNGAVQYFEDDLEKALGLAKKSLDVEDQEKVSLSYSLMAKMMLNNKKYAEARELYTKAIEADEDNVEPYLFLGHYYLNENKSEEALKYFNKALEIDSTKIEVYELIGQAYLVDKKYDEATKALEKAVSISGKNPTSLYNLMLAYYEAKLYDKAIDKGKEVLAMEDAEGKVLTKVYNLMGQIYKDKKDYKTAIAVMKESIDKGVNDCFAYSIIAFSYNQLGNRSAATSWANKYEECEKNQ
jgi:tetratricopeptide (TPR) repeat protein